MQLCHVQCASPVRNEISEHPRRLHPRTVRMRAGSRKSKHHASMPLETIAKSLEYCIEVVVTNKEEVKEAMGTTH